MTTLDDTFKDAGWIWDEEVAAWRKEDGDRTEYVVPVGMALTGPITDDRVESLREAIAEVKMAFPYPPSWVNV